MTLFALQKALIADGHQVIICGPTQNNSGGGGKLDFLNPFTPMATASQSGLIPAGSPGTGAIKGYPSIYYVNGTPADCALYGIDIAAGLAWGAGTHPDLVVSGPNYGNNTGMLNTVSGTVNAAIVALNRGIPAIAVSAAVPSTYKVFTSLAPTDLENEDAALIVKLVDALVSAKALAGGALLPPTVGLNVNFPTFTAGGSTKLPWKFTHVGTAAAAYPYFVANLGADPIAHAYGVPAAAAFPGITMLPNGMPAPAGTTFVTDTDPTSEQNAITAGNVTISVIRGNVQANRAPEAAVRIKLLPLAQ